MKVNNKLLLKIIVFIILVFISVIITSKIDVYIIECDLGDVIKKDYEITYAQNEIYTSELKDFSIDGKVLTSTSNDPWIFLNIEKVNIFKYIKINIDLLGREEINAQFFFLPANRDGYFSEGESVRKVLKNGDNYIRLREEKCRALRLDLVEEEGISIVVNSIDLTNKKLPALPKLLLLVLINISWCGFWFYFIFMNINVKYIIIINNLKKLYNKIRIKLNMFNKEIDTNNKYLLLFNYIWLLPVLFSLIIICILGVNVIYWDEWELIKLYEVIEKNGIFNFNTLKQFSLQHNEHIMFFSKIILLISYKISHFNSVIAMILTQMMLIILYFIYIKYIYNIQNTILICDNILKNIFILIIGIACFNYIQWNNLTWGFQFAFYMTIFCSVICLYNFHMYYNTGYIRFCFISLLFGIISSFSCLHGIIVWPVIIILMIFCLLNGQKIIIKNGIPFVITGIICFIVYFKDWKHISHHPEFSYNLIKILKYLFSSLGGMFTGIYSSISILLGILLITFIIYLLIDNFRRGIINEALFPIGLIGYGCASLLTIAVGRAGFGLETSISSRYMSFSILVCIGCVLLIFKKIYYNNADQNNNIIKKYNEKILLYGCVVIISLLLFNGNLKGVFQAKAHSKFYKENVTILQNYENQSLYNLNRIYPWISYEIAYKDIEKLKKYRLNVFSSTIFNFNEIPITKINGLEKIELTHWQGIGSDSFIWDNKNIYTRTSCWAVDYINQKSYTQVYMKINDRLYKTADHMKSPDVANHFNNKNYSNVRFSFSFPIESMNIGENCFSAIVILIDGIKYFETDKIIIIKNDDESIILL